MRNIQYFIFLTFCFTAISVMPSFACVSYDQKKIIEETANFYDLPIPDQDRLLIDDWKSINNKKMPNIIFRNITSDYFTAISLGGTTHWLHGLREMKKYKTRQNMLELVNATHSLFQNLFFEFIAKKTYLLYLNAHDRVFPASAFVRAEEAYITHKRFLSANDQKAIEFELTIAHCESASHRSVAAALIHFTLIKN